MLAQHKIPSVVLLSVVLLLSIGELVAGTSVSFVAMMAAAMLCIGITYNMLGGSSTIGGIFFAAYALDTLVISQFAKVLFYEASDKDLEVPQLTMAIYMVFYLCVMVGTFLFGRFRLNLPKPLDTETRSQAGLLYTVSVSVGLLATSGILQGAQTQHSAERNFTLVFSSLLLFSIVLAVIGRVTDTGGQHSFGLKVFFPWAAYMVLGFLGTSRSGVVVPNFVYFVTCYASGYRFKRRHYLTVVLSIVALVTVISPVEMYLRQFREESSFRERNAVILQHLAALPDWSSVKEATEVANSAGGDLGASYFDRPGTFILSRVSMIRMDSVLIDTCSRGLHYGFAGLKNDLLMQIPYSLYKNKPVTSSSGYLGHLTGVTSDEIDNGYASFSAISDSYGAFGWWGVIMFGLFAFPAIFIIYESMFDMRRPWGIVAMGILVSTGVGASMGNLAGLALRTPIEILLVSYLVVGIVRMIPNKGDQYVALKP
jgi:hypothetical protein